MGSASLLPALGRVLICIIFLFGAYGKITNMEGTIGYINAAHLPQPQIAYYISVAVELLGGIALLIGLFTRWVGLGLAVWCLITAVLFHYHPDQQAQMVNFLKNLAMAGGLLYVAAFGAGSISVDGSRR